MCSVGITDKDIGSSVRAASKKGDEAGGRFCFVEEVTDGHDPNRCRRLHWFRARSTSSNILRRRWRQ